MTKHNQKKLLIFSTASMLLFLAVLLFTPTQAHAAITIEPLWKVLQTNSNVKSVWKEVRNFVNILVVAVLIFIAFANILRINLNNYAIKKFLPSLIAAILLTNFSYFICQFLIDLANVTLGLLMNGATSTKSASNFVGSGNIGVAGAFDFTLIKEIDTNNIGRSALYILGELVGAIMIFIMAFLFYIRNYVIYFLVGIAPLACMALALPQTKNLFNQWFSMLNKWIFMPIISVFWLWVGGVWYSSGFDPKIDAAPIINSQGVKPGADFSSTLFGLAFAIVCYYLAMTTPFKMGGSIMSGFAKFGKNMAKQANNVHGNLQAAAQNEADRYKGTKRGDRGAVMRNILAGTNYQTYKKGWEARTGQISGNREKAISKSAMYGRVAGPEAQAKALAEIAQEDYKYFSGNEIAGLLDKPVEGGRGNLDNLIHNVHKLKWANGIKKNYTDWETAQAGANGGAGPTDQEKRQKMANLILDAGPAKLINQVRGAGIAGVASPKEAAELYAQIVQSRKIRKIEAENLRGPNGYFPSGGTAVGEDVDEEVVERRVHEDVQRMTHEADRSIGHRQAIMEEIAAAHGGSDDPASIKRAEDKLKEIQGHAEAGLTALSNDSLDAAKEAAMSINKDKFTVALGANDPAQLKSMLGEIFQEASQMGKMKSSDLAAQLSEFNKNPGNWRDATKNAQLADAPIRARNEVLAGTIKIDGASMEGLTNILKGHLDSVMETNADLAQMMAENTNHQFDKAISEARNSMTIQTNSAIKNQIVPSGDGGAVTPADIARALTKALSDPKLAKIQSEAMATAVKNAGPTVIHDVTPPPPPSA